MKPIVGEGLVAQPQTAPLCPSGTSPAGRLLPVHCQKITFSCGANPCFCNAVLRPPDVPITGTPVPKSHHDIRYPNGDFLPFCTLLKIRILCTYCTTHLSKFSDTSLKTALFTIFQTSIEFLFFVCYDSTRSRESPRIPPTFNVVPDTLT